MSDPALGRCLLKLARGAIEMRFGSTRPEASHPTLDEPGATFVTLKCDGALRGCIGTLVAVRLLRADVMHNALNAAFADPRFPPLDERELHRLELEVSKLGVPAAMACSDEQALLRELRPHIDGVVLCYGPLRGTFLPQVWESLPEPREFVRELKRKAGLPADFWHDGIEISRYTVDKWTERDHLLEIDLALQSGAPAS
ncbi:MAG TPA: AmmeMemoRadiSam system protein A [Casimicrobiaceae bacterium]|nr:AmmeMemoRadiSam system protein A [Casimicrobiaceae bacterium]